MQSESVRMQEIKSESADRLHFRLISLIRMSKEIVRFHNSYNEVFVKKMKDLNPLSLAKNGELKAKTEMPERKRHPREETTQTGKTY